MNDTSIKRKELGKFLRETGSWSLLSIRAAPEMGRVFDLTLGHAESRQVFWRLHAIGTTDFAIRPKNPATIAGGQEMRLITDDPRLSDPRLQYVPGGDGEIYSPPRRYQLLELDQSWIIAERFEIEPLPQVKIG